MLRASLCRQLLEQRDALAAVDSAAEADRERGVEGNKDEKTSSGATAADDSREGDTDASTAQAFVDVDSNGSAEDVAIDTAVSKSNAVAATPAAHASSSPAAAIVENRSRRHSETNGREVNMKVESAAELMDNVSDVEMESVEDPTEASAAVTSPTFAKRRVEEEASVSVQHVKSGGVADDNVDRKKRSRENSAADAAAILEKRLPVKRVVRTSIPSRKYQDGSQHHHGQEFSRTTSVQPTLISSTETDSQFADDQNLQLSHRSAPRELSMEQIHGDFEKQLHDSVRLSKEVRSRSLSMTRKRQLPRLSMPSREKSHWDYLLEEMKWMATDFSQERNWKRAMQYHLAKNVIIAQNAEKVRQEKENRQLAREIALQVSAFWRSMERIATRSRVRFEAGGDVSKDSELSVIAKEKQATETAAIDESTDKHSSSVNGDESGVALKFKKIEIESGSAEERCVVTAKEKMKRIVAAGRKGREALLFNAESEVSSTSLTEIALQEVQSRSSSANGSRTILAAFQVMALRWMLELYTAGLNMFLNDQLGMGKAATISAFLSLVSVLDAQVVSSPSKSNERGPHLVIVAEEELHKWQFNLRVWCRQWRVQLYEGTSGCRKLLQREWKKKALAAGASEFLHDSEGDELWEEENQPLFCVLCPVSAFAEDHEDFVQFKHWQMLVVENEFDDLFEDSKILTALKHIPQQSRRILCNGRSVENWTSISLRNQYAEFLLRNGAEAESEEWSSDVWTQLLLLDKSSAAQAMQLCGKPANAVASLLKSAQQENQNHVSALLVAMYCLGLRRVRSEVEPQLGKIEEQSLSCKLTGSQMTQYRNAISGFATSVSTMNEREERLEMWLQLFLRLRVICNCVDIVNDFDKLALADMRVIASCSAKLDALSSLLTRLVNKEEKRVVVYCQFNGMFPILEMCLTLLDVSFVRITGDARMQRRALSHFAGRFAVKVALASTRLSCAQGTRAVSIYGADAIIVLDSDWNAICDAKLRACWAKMAVGKELVPVYRLHCEQTIEASLLRVGACFSEKVFGEMTPQELLAVPSDLLVGSALEKPSWWTSNANPGTAAANVIAKLGDVAQQGEEEERYCGDESELERPLIVHNIDLDAEEHLLLSNTDELTPVEWYAVNYVHGLTDKKRSNHGSNGPGSHEDEHSSEGWTEAHYMSNARTFDELVTLENKHAWQDGDTEQQLFYQPMDSSDAFAPVDDKTVEKLLKVLRSKGVETHYNVYQPPQPPALGRKELFSESGTADGNQMMFHVSYRVPAPPAPPVPVKIKSEQSSQALQSDSTAKTVKVKKQRSSTAGVPTTGSAVRPGGAAPSATSVAGVKRKLEQQSGGAAGVKTPATKEQRVDLEGIPLPDVAEFEDDDFWGDTNLDALDSASWDDASVLSGILGPSVDSNSSAKSASGATTSTATQDGATATTQRPSTKKLKGSTGAGANATTNRARKGSVSSDAGRDGWSAQDDLVLKKLFELYGSNWTLIAQVFNSTTAVSRFFCKKRSPRQCYDRYGKIISGSLSGSSSAAANAPGVKDGKKASKANAAAAAVMTPEMLDARIGLPGNEMLLVFSARNSLPGLPPPSIINVPNLVEMSMRKKKMQKQQPAGNSSGSGDAGGMDDLKSIRNSFDAIIQCMKRKTAPPPIPIPTASTASSDFSMKASLTATGAASFTPSPASKAAKASSSQVQASKSAADGAVPPLHKSHTDIITLLPSGPVAPDDVIKRSKEVAAVQAAAAVASVGRDVSPLSAAGDAILGAAFGANRKPSYAGSTGMASGAGAVNSRVPVSGGTGMAHSAPGAKLPTPSAGIAASTSAATTSSPAWGDMSSLHHMARGVGGSMSAIDLNSSSVIGGSGLSPASVGISVVGSGTAGSSGNAAGGSANKPPMPVTTSTLLHVLDRMPEIKNKIQTILNRNDCSEAQKVTMIARLLSNTNAINNSGVLPTSGVTPTSSLATQSMSTASMANHQSNAVSVVSSSVMGALTGGGVDSSTTSPAIIDLETPIPMPASLASAPTPTTSHLPANAALLMESLATSPVSTPTSYPPSSTQP